MQSIFPDNELVASDLLAGMYASARKFGYTVLAINQVPEQFLKSRHGMDTSIFQLAGFSILMSGPKAYVNILQQLYGLAQSEREHLLYSIKGSALLVRQDDLRPRKIRIKPHGRRWPQRLA